MSTNFDLSIKNLFDGIDEDKVHKKFFSTRTRSLLVDNILRNIDLSKKEIKTQQEDSDDESEQG